MTSVPDIFLSYSREDQARAKLFADAFAAQGFSVWWDVGLRTGEAYDEVTEAALRGAKAVVVLWSKISVASRWVRAEATLADRNKTLVPVKIEACERPIMFELTQTAELMHWQGEAGDAAFVAFLEDVTRFVGREAAPVKAGSRMDIEQLRDSGTDLPGIALAAFSVRSGAPGDAEIARSLADEIFYGLSGSNTLRVVSAVHDVIGLQRRSDEVVPPFMSGVRYSVQGSLWRATGVLRVGMQILDAATGEVLWAQRFDRAADDAMGMLDELAGTILGHLYAQFERCEERRILQAGEELTLAERLRRAGMLLSRWRLEESIADAERALALAPRSARAHSVMAVTCGFIFSVGGGAALQERALEHGNRALKIDGFDREVVGDVAEAFIYAGDAPRGVAMLERLQRAVPHDANVSIRLVFGYLVVGRFEEARAALNAFRQQRPYSSASPHLSMCETMICLGERDPAAARQIAEDGLGGSVVYPSQLLYHSLACAQLADQVQARASLKKARDLGGKRFALHMALHAFTVFFQDPSVLARLSADLERLWAEVDALEAP